MAGGRRWTVVGPELRPTDPIVNSAAATAASVTAAAAAAAASAGLNFQLLGFSRRYSISLFLLLFCFVFGFALCGFC